MEAKRRGKKTRAMKSMKETEKDVEVELARFFFFFKWHRFEPVLITIVGTGLRRTDAKSIPNFFFCFNKLAPV